MSILSFYSNFLLNGLKYNSAWHDQGPALFVLGLDRAFVPATQQQPRQKIEQRVDDDAGHRQHQQRREHARDRETVAGFQNAEGEPGLGAAGPGDELGYHR